MSWVYRRPAQAQHRQRAPKYHPAAPPHTTLDSGDSTTDATSIATASISPTGDNLILAAVSSTTASGYPNVPTASGNGLTWVRVNRNPGIYGTNKRLTLFRAMGASPSSGAITFDFGGQTQTDFAWSVVEYPGVDTSGANGAGAIGQIYADLAGFWLQDSGPQLVQVVDEMNEQGGGPLTIGVFVGPVDGAGAQNPIVSNTLSDSQGQGALIAVDANGTIVRRGTETTHRPSGSTTITINKPSDIVEDDIMFAWISHESASSTWTPPSGWTQIGSDLDNTTVNSGCWYKVAGASEPSSYQWTNGTGNEMLGAITGLGNIDTVTPISDSATTADSNGPVDLSVTPTDANDWLVMMVGVENSSVATDTFLAPRLFDFAAANATYGVMAKTDGADADVAGDRRMVTRSSIHNLGADRLYVQHTATEEPVTDWGWGTARSAIAFAVEIVAAPDATTVDAGLATETDTALAPDILRQYAAGLPVETDTALVPVLLRQYAAGLASATDTALAISFLFGINVGLATATDTALPVTILREYAAGLATESDSALGATVVDVLDLPVGLATETDTALGPTVIKTVLPGFAVGTDTALPVTYARIYTAGLPAATDTALAAEPVKGYPAQLASESATALGVTIARVYAPTVADETDTALGAVALREYLLGLATATDTALAVTIDQGILLDAGRADETNTALGVTIARVYSVGLSSEADTALSAVTLRQYTAGLATETDTALGTTIGKPVDALLASESATALGVTIARVYLTGLPSESDVALAVVALREYVLGLADETDSALAATAVKGYLAGLAAETDTAFAIAVARSYLAGLATATDTALGVTVDLGDIQVGLADETDTALAVTVAIARFLAVGIATETATALTATVMIRRRAPAPGLGKSFEGVAAGTSSSGIRPGVTGTHPAAGASTEQDTPGESVPVQSGGDS
jgi:hypothetical protein